MKKLIIILSCVLLLSACGKKAPEPLPVQEGNVGDTGSYIYTDVTDTAKESLDILGLNGVKKASVITIGSEDQQSYNEITFKTEKNAKDAFNAYKDQFLAKDDILDTKENDSSLVVYHGSSLEKPECNALSIVSVNGDKVLVAEEFGAVAGNGITIKGITMVSDENKEKMLQMFESLGYPLP